MRGQTSGFSVIVILLVVMGAFGALLWANSRPVTPALPVVPTEAQPTENANAWQEVLRAGFGSGGTPIPTIAIPQQPYVAPTLALGSAPTSTPVQASELGSQPDAVVAVAATPTRPAPTAADTAEAAVVTAQAATPLPVEQWRPPALLPPLNRDPLGRDHYWFIRPVDSNANNAGLFYYPYGSDGPSKENPLIVHHGIDMPNPIGQVVRAAGSGWVTWASDGLRTTDGIFENSPSYGNVVRIEHDFGYEGQKLWTIYAHLSATLVVNGQYVRAGDAIGLVGNTGRVSGPHMHFEVRMGEDRYRSTYNPVLWMVPYVGTGVIAGRVVDERGELAQDADVTVRNWATGLQQDTTTTYVYTNTESEVNADPNWGENFAIGDVPVGRYQVIVTLNGQRIVELVNVYEGMTTFVELKPEPGQEVEPVTVTPSS